MRTAQSGAPNFTASLERELEQCRGINGKALEEAFAARLLTLLTPLTATQREQAINALTTWSLEAVPPGEVFVAIGRVSSELGLAEETPAFLGNDRETVSVEVPSHIRTVSAREQFGLQPGDSLLDPIRRQDDGDGS